jgi:hypothetical protein
LSGMSPGGLVSTTAGPDGLDPVVEDGFVRGADGDAPLPDELHAVSRTRAATAAPPAVSARLLCRVSDVR